MSQRDVIAEIVALRKRQKRFENSFAVTAHTGELLKLVGSSKKELGHRTKCSRSIALLTPVRIVAILQSYLRITYAKIIDSDARFLVNCSSGFPELRIKLDQLAGIKSEGLSVGRFVAHFLQPNSFSEALSMTGKVAGDDFAGALREYINSRETHLVGNPEDRWSSFAEKMTNIFNYRHQICHEVVVPRALTPPRAAQMALVATVFVFGVHHFVADLGKRPKVRRRIKSKP